jgi:Arc-like DNA binding domain
VADSDPYRFLLRMPQRLRAELHEAAQRNGRSLNLEIVGRLEASVVRPVAVARRRRALATAAVAVVLGVSSVLGLVGRSASGDADEALPAGHGLKYALTVGAGRTQSTP